MSQQPRWEDRFAEKLLGLVKDRAAMARLRRGVGAPPDRTLASMGWLFRAVPDHGHGLDAAVCAAGLFAWTKGRCPHRADVDFGQAFGAGLTLDQKQQRERRFVDLLETDADELPYKLRQAITLIERDGVALDWAMLTRHLVQWDHPDRWVQKQWARGYWSSAEEAAESDAAIEAASA